VTEVPWRQHLRQRTKPLVHPFERPQPHTLPRECIPTMCGGALVLAALSCNAKRGWEQIPRCLREGTTAWGLWFWGVGFRVPGFRCMAWNKAHTSRCGAYHLGAIGY